MPNDSIFNPDALLDTTYEVSPEKNYTPIDEGEYPLIIKKIDVRQTQSQDGRTFNVADFTMVVDDEKVKEKLKMQEPSARLSIFLDLKPGTNELAFGTNVNVPLGRLKAACGLKEGRKWSMRHLLDQRCWGRIKQEADRNDPERIYSRVVQVTSAPTTMKDKEQGGGRQAA